MATPAAVYGAMLAGVDYVLMGAGIPREIPRLLDALAAHRPVRCRSRSPGQPRGDRHTAGLDPPCLLAGTWPPADGPGAWPSSPPTSWPPTWRATSTSGPTASSWRAPRRRAQRAPSRPDAPRRPRRALLRAPRRRRHRQGRRARPAVLARRWLRQPRRPGRGAAGRRHRHPGRHRFRAVPRVRPAGRPARPAAPRRRRLA